MALVAIGYTDIFTVFQEVSKFLQLINTSATNTNIRLLEANDVWGCISENEHQRRLKICRKITEQLVILNHVYNIFVNLYEYIIKKDRIYLFYIMTIDFKFLKRTLK